MCALPPRCSQVGGTSYKLTTHTCTFAVGGTFEAELQVTSAGGGTTGATEATTTAVVSAVLTRREELKYPVNGATDGEGTVDLPIREEALETASVREPKLRAFYATVTHANANACTRAHCTRAHACMHQ